MNICPSDYATGRRGPDQWGWYKQQLVWAAATSKALRLLEGKWRIVIVVQLFAVKVPLRFSALEPLERLVEGVNQKLLIQQLKALDKDGIVTRTIYPKAPPRVEYAFSPIGLALGASIEMLTIWASMRRRMTTEVPADHAEVTQAQISMRLELSKRACVHRDHGAGN